MIDEPTTRAPVQEADAGVPERPAGNHRLAVLLATAFILIGSWVGDLIGRKRAYVLGRSSADSSPPMYNALKAGLSLAPLSLTMFAVALLAGNGVGTAGLRAEQLHAVADLGGAGQRDGRRELEQRRVADTLEHDAQVMSNSWLERQLADEPEQTRAEIIRINTDARHIALQVALPVPILAGLIGLVNSFRMMRLPDPAPSGAAEGMAPG